MNLNNLFYEIGVLALLHIFLNFINNSSLEDPGKLAFLLLYHNRLNNIPATFQKHNPILLPNNPTSSCSLHRNIDIISSNHFSLNIRFNKFINGNPSIQFQSILKRN